MNFSVAMCVYRGDNVDWFIASVDSVFNNTCPPSELVLVVDGPIGEKLSEVVHCYEVRSDFRAIYLDQNMGQGYARRIALSHVVNELVAIMDADDICALNRFETQMRYMQEHPEVDVVGGNIEEFIGQPEHLAGRRIVPQENMEIYRYMRRRCPFNQMTVMFRRSAVEQAGGYLPWHYNEDYYLWLRMAGNASNFHNLPNILVHVRVGKDMYVRRGGWQYFLSEYRLQQYMLKKHFIGPIRFIWNSVQRLILQVLMPNWLRGWVFRTLARE